jgi:hypothetical protein
MTRRELVEEAACAVGVAVIVTAYIYWLGLVG